MTDPTPGEPWRVTDLAPEEQQLNALLDLFPRTGAQAFEIRFSEPDGAENVQAVVWLAIADYGEHGWDTAAGQDPLTAAKRLSEQLMDGGRCTHCGRPSAIDHEVRRTPLIDATDETLCWYRYDPELNVYRRSCEGQTRKPGNPGPFAKTRK